MPGGALYAVHMCRIIPALRRAVFSLLHYYNYYTTTSV